MLDEDESHAVAGGKGTYELPTGVKAASGCADAHDRKISRVCWWTPRRKLTRAFRGPARLFLARTMEWHGMNILRSLAPTSRQSSHYHCPCAAARFLARKIRTSDCSCPGRMRHLSSFR